MEGGVDGVLASDPAAAQAMAGKRLLYLRPDDNLALVADELVEVGRCSIATKPPAK
jgi:hypothetical protein